MADFDHLNIRAFLADLHDARQRPVLGGAETGARPDLRRYLRREGILDGDPAALVGTPRREQPLPAHLGEAEMSTLLEMPDPSPPLGRRDRAILELFYASGLRLSELVGLDLGDVNLIEPDRARPRQRREGTDRSVQPERPTEAIRRMAEGRGRHPGAARRAGVWSESMQETQGDAVVPEPSWRTTDHTQRGSDRETDVTEAAIRKHQPARPPPHVRDAPAEAWPTCERSRSCSGHARLTTTQRYTHLDVGAPD